MLVQQQSPNANLLRGEDGLFKVSFPIPATVCASNIQVYTSALAVSTVQSNIPGFMLSSVICSPSTTSFGTTNIINEITKFTDTFFI